MENSIYKNKNIEKLERKQNVNRMQKNQFVKIKNSLSILEKDFIELKDRELKNRQVKVKRD